MIHTEQLSPDTIMLHVRGAFLEKTAKELSLVVFRSHLLGIKTFLCNLSQVSLIDDRGHHQLSLIGEGLNSKGHTWKIIQPPLLGRRPAHSSYLSPTHHSGYVELMIPYQVSNVLYS
ncbi:MAG: hypothetical protein O7F12_11655 [Nitrospirae bacterium]|nr:hypothetical protein [Nitrospirota bacterium]